METYPEQFPDNNTARVPAALLGGLFACYLTHPADTCKVGFLLAVLLALSVSSFVTNRPHLLHDHPPNRPACKVTLSV